MGKNLYGVTVIIPVYNTEKYLKECIDSVLNQTYKHYEVIIVNDGSTDSSVEIVKSYIKGHSNLRLLEQENKGQGSARNMAIKQAKGKYLYFMDSDDYILPDTIEKAYNKCEENQLDLVLFDGQAFYDSDFAENIILNYRYTRSGVYDEIYSGEVLLEKLIKNNDYFVSPCLYMLNKEIIYKHNLYFPEGIIHEDELFTFRLFKYANRVMHINKILFMRRYRKNSTMTSVNAKKSFQGYYRVFYEIYKKEYDKNRGLQDYATKEKLGSIYTAIFSNFNVMACEDKKKHKEEIIALKRIGMINNYFDIRFGYIKTHFFKLYKLLANFKQIVIKGL